MADAWKALERRSTAPLVWFQTYDWCRNWIAAHAGDTCRPHVLLLWDGPRLAAVWPLMLERQGLGVTLLRSLGEPHTQYAGVLTENGTLTQSEADTLMKGLLATPKVDTMFINLVPASSPLEKAMPCATIAPELRNEAAYLDLTCFGGSAGYRHGLNKAQRRSRKRSVKTLEQDGALELQVLRPGMPGFAGLVERCVRFKRTWLAQTGRVSSGLEIDDHAGFLASLPACDGGRDGPYLFALTAGGKPVAIEIGFLRHDHYYSYLGGFDWAKREASPGKIQMEMTVCWLIDHGVKAFDLLGNPAGYKQTWTNKTTALHGHVVNITPAGWAYSALWITRGRPIVKKLYQTLPPGFRVGLGAIRKLGVWYVG